MTVGEANRHNWYRKVKRKISASIRCFVCLSDHLIDRCLSDHLIDCGLSDHSIDCCLSDHSIDRCLSDHLIDRCLFARFIVLLIEVRQFIGPIDHVWSFD